MLAREEFNEIRECFIDWAINDLQGELAMLEQATDVSLERYKKMGDSFESICSFATKHMKISRLDRHKAVVITVLCILECRPFFDADVERDTLSPLRKRPKLFYLANEILALRVGLELLKAFMLDSIASGHSIKLDVLVNSNIEIEYPSIISDGSTNESNLIGMFYRLHESSKKFEDFNEKNVEEKFLYHSFWMLAQIFYHIESFNRELIIKNINSYKRTS